MEQLFNLGNRLCACADMVRKGTKFVDVGTDHAYLPIWLLKRGHISTAIAIDVNDEPLKKAQANMEKYQMQEFLQIRKSDGLQRVQPEEADEIVIAGMGGNLIAQIVESAEWLKASSKHLILQPMSSAVDLRISLSEQGFDIFEEKAVVDREKTYSVLSVSFTGEKRTLSVLEKFMGKISPGTKAAEEYANRIHKDMKHRLCGLTDNKNEADEYRAALMKIEEQYLGICNL